MRFEVVLWAGLGAAVALVGVAWLGDDGAVSEPPVSEANSGDSVPMPVPSSSRATSPVESSPVATTEARPAGGEIPNAAAAPTSNLANNPIVAGAPPSNQPPTPTDLPNRRDGDSSMPAADLLDSLTITCDFGAGNSTGLRFGQMLTVGGGAQWGGGLFTYDSIDLIAGTARLTGSVGVTGSESGEAKMQVTTEGTRIFLSGFLEDRTYVLVTIFDDVDNVGRRIAVMSRHEGAFTYGSQFLGTCQ